MDKREFKKYCDGIAALEVGGAQWDSVDAETVGEYIGARIDGGAGLVLAKLAVPAVLLIKSELKKRGDGWTPDLAELSGRLASENKRPHFTSSAYYFVICVTTVALGKADPDDIEEEDFDSNDFVNFDTSAMMDEVCDEARRNLRQHGLRLLDFSRRNQLVHFNENRTSSLILHSPSPAATAQKVMNGNRIYLSGWERIGRALRVMYKCKICGRSGMYGYTASNQKVQPSQICPVCDANNLHGRRSMTAVRERLVLLPDGGYECECGMRIRLEDIEGNDFACPQCRKKIVFPTSPLAPSAVLKSYMDNELVSTRGDVASAATYRSLESKARKTERDFGLHILYLVCGFLSWKDAVGTEYKSPLLLCPVNIAVERTNGLYYVQIDELADGVLEVNKTLLHMLKAYGKSVSIVLPEFDSANPEAYLRQVAQFLSDTAGPFHRITGDWTVADEFGLGMFHYQKLQLEHDLRENEDEYLSNPIIRRLCGDMKCALEAVPCARSDGFSRYMLLDADSSQEEAIKASREGKSFILQGPPGSGKSQTITNIIAEAMGAGKTVLFVTEKATARAVIIDNLQKCVVGDERKLTDFVLDFSSFKERGGAIGREPFVRALNNCLGKYVPTGGYDVSLLLSEASGRRYFDSFSEQLRTAYDGKKYLRLLQDAVAYVDSATLASFEDIPTDGDKFVKMCDSVALYLDAVKRGDVSSINYGTDRLYGCLGDKGHGLADAADKYIAVTDGLQAVADTLKPFGFRFNGRREGVEAVVRTLRLWAGAPSFARTVLNGLTPVRLDALVATAESRRRDFANLSRMKGAAVERTVNKANFSVVDVADLEACLAEHKSVFKRFGVRYKSLLGTIFGCFDYGSTRKQSYIYALIALQELKDYQQYIRAKTAFESQAARDIAMFGYEPLLASDWDALCDRLALLRSIAGATDTTVLDPYGRPEWLLSFASETHAGHTTAIQAWADGTETLMAELDSAARTMLSYFSHTPYADAYYPEYCSLAKMIAEEKDRLAKWYDALGIISEIENAGCKSVFGELIRKNVTDFAVARDMLYKAYYAKLVAEFVDKNGLDCVRNFDRATHERKMREYAAADVAVLRTGPKRLYEVLATALGDKAYGLSRGRGGEYPKIQSKTHYSIKQTIAENWDYIGRIKPCFMMSPLNVSQYIAASLRFDMVIFDEASQIFTEDALAAISRGRQVIIAGDSKQLPPGSFFRAGDSWQDAADSYYDDDADNEHSLLVAADRAFPDMQRPLAWHYRSCDESLIHFSNVYMDYNLISFPSAVRDPNDGVYCVRVPYSPATCYVSGKKGTHINVGEADKIVQLLYEEMTHPERKRFSLGVVAFSNAQAAEIEDRWERFKQDPSRKSVIEAWEAEHEDEPIIFCNLDTVQGDERDTTIISVCYSPDADNKFRLLYLGGVRTAAGKKRINVAITRARHRMVVVSTWDTAELARYIRESGASEENKEGAVMLLRFLEYAQSCDDSHTSVHADTSDAFVRSVCKVLDGAGIAYHTEIGRSKCKVNIGILAPGSSDDYVMGIIVDDPNRQDFDSVREYTRLTQQVLCDKYNWTIYRLFPTAWMTRFDVEKTALLDAVRARLAAYGR